MTLSKRFPAQIILICILCLLQRPYAYPVQIIFRPTKIRRKLVLNKNPPLERLTMLGASAYQKPNARASESPSVANATSLFISRPSHERGLFPRCSRFIPFLLAPFILSSFACLLSASPIQQSLKSIRYAVPWKRAVQIVFFMFIVSSTVSTFRMKQRQSMDATSEWARYAQRPSARGRAIVWLVIRQAIYIAMSQLLSFRRSAILRFAGLKFAEGLLRLGPLYIKLGQIMSSQRGLLGPEWIEDMGILQDRVPARAGEEALNLVYSTLEGGKTEFATLFSEFDSTPLAAASLGQVHRAKLRKTGDVVAVKVQRPYLRQIYDQDLEFLTNIAKLMDSIPGSSKNVGGVSSSWTKIFEDAEEILYREIDYRDEAKNGMRFSEDFGVTLGGKAAMKCQAKSRDGQDLPSAADWIRTPYVFEDVSSERLLVMEYVPSIKVTDIAKLDAAGVTASDRVELADALARAYLRQFCCNLFFSTDPHAGNLGVEILENGKPRLVIYDFGQATSLSQDQADGILDIIEAIIDMDVERSIDAFVKMGVLVDGADLDKVRSKVAENYRTGKVKANRKKLRGKGYLFKNRNETQVVATYETNVEVKDSEVMSFFTLPAEYAFVARALSQMDGVGKVLDPDFDFISNSAPYIVEIKGAQKYLKDEAVKFFKNFLSRGYSSTPVLDIQRKVTDIQMRQIPKWYEDGISKQ